MKRVVTTRIARVVAAALVLAAAAGTAQAQQPSAPLVVAATDIASPVLKEFLPKFTESSALKVEYSIRTGAEAADLARAGKVDAIMTDDPTLEESLLKSQDASKRLDIMYAELIVVGPAADPARIAGMASVVHAFAILARTQSPFVSRGDKSGVHRTEREIWEEAGVALTGGGLPWYAEARGDMGATLAAASQRNAYTIADKASWLQFTTRGQLVVMVQDDPRLQQRLSLTLVNPRKHKVNAAGAEALGEWLVSRDTQLAIGRFALGGEQPYAPHFGLSGK